VILDCRSYSKSVLNAKVGRALRWNELQESVSDQIVSELFECLLVLDFGQQLGSIPLSPLQRLGDEHFKPLFYNLWTEGVRGIESPNRTEFVHHSRRSEVLLKEFRKFYRVLESGMRGEPFWGVQEVGVKNPRGFQPLFDQFLRLHAQMVTDSSVGRFSYSLRYSTQWQAFQFDDVRAEELYHPDNQENPAALILRGFLTFIGQFGEIKKLLDRAADEHDSADAYRFSERIRDILNWRFDFASAAVFKRFEQLREVVTRRVELENPGNARQVRKAIEESLDSVFGYWLEPA
jgi:hypothetical protein